MAKELAALADVYVNDAFSAAHRAHASTEGVAKLLPAYAGRLMQAELRALDAVLGHPEHPLAAVIGGAKVSTKLGLLGNLIGRVNVLVLGGVMANTFLAAEGVAIGQSMQEPDMYPTARDILARARKAGCEVFLPRDVAIADKLASNANTKDVSLDAVPANAMIFDFGPVTIRPWCGAFQNSARSFGTVLSELSKLPPSTEPALRWPTPSQTPRKLDKLISIAGGGDTIAAFRHAGVADRFTYVATTGGAFLEWLEGRTLPGVAVLGGNHRNPSPLPPNLSCPTGLGVSFCAKQNVETIRMAREIMSIFD